MWWLYVLMFSRSATGCILVREPPFLCDWLEGVTYVCVYRMQLFVIKCISLITE